jgi:hypothetical protein
MRFHFFLGIALLVLVCAPLTAQTSTPTHGQTQVQRRGDNPIYKITINVVERQTSAVNLPSPRRPDAARLSWNPAVA